MATASITQRPASTSAFQSNYNNHNQRMYDSRSTQQQQHQPRQFQQRQPQQGGQRQRQPRNANVLVQPTGESNSRYNTNNGSNSAPTSTMAFYVPQGTPCFVSCDDGQWHSGVWGDNHRTITVYRSRRGPNPVFVRFADVVLSDDSGFPMYMAANRSRPCFITFPTELPISLYIESANPASKTPGFEPIAVDDAFALGVAQYQQAHQQQQVQRTASVCSIRTASSEEVSSECLSVDGSHDSELIQ